MSTGFDHFSDTRRKVSVCMCVLQLRTPVVHVHNFSAMDHVAWRSYVVGQCRANVSEL